MVSRVQQLKKMVAVKVGRGAPRVVSHKTAAAAIADLEALERLRADVEKQIGVCRGVLVAFARRRGLAPGKKVRLTAGGAVVTLRDVSRPKGAK